MKKNLKKGDWLFTCAMKPKQFGEYCPRNRADYGEVENEEEFLEWCKYDDFLTLEGSSHSQGNCGCKPISEKYAKWFLEKEIHNIYDEFIGDKSLSDEEYGDLKWSTYIELVKARCKEDNIEYEGI